MEAWKSSGLWRKVPGCPHLRVCRLGAGGLFRARTRKGADGRRSGALISLESLLQLNDALHDLFESSPRFA